VIEDEVVIFPNSVVVGGITIGARAVIGAGSVVIADVPADSIVTGNPAKLLRMRSHDS
jgi:acetyltransferase-like isoleucine patch superfamily enzyme